MAIISEKDFQAKVDYLHEQCKKTNKFPSFQLLLNVLQLTEEEYFALLDSSRKLARLDKIEVQNRKAYLQQLMLDEPSKTSACINLLKDPDNGGKIDGEDNTLSIKHNISGIQDKSIFD